VDDCIFCRIANGETSANTVFENDEVIAFDDVAPQAPVHSLVIPKTHCRSLNEDVSADTLAALLSGAREVARIKGVSESGYRVIINNGADANQTVPHLHLHVMGGRSMSHGMVSFGREA
jgi:histidine triad (HIT) family protein